MTVKHKTYNVLVIDDDPIIRNVVRSYLKDKVNVFAVETPSTGFRIIENEEIDLLITDFKLPEMDGLKVLEKVKKEYPHIEVIMISSSTDMNTVIGALRKGAADYCKKPFDASTLWLSIERTRKFAKLQDKLSNEVVKNKMLKEEVEREIGIQLIGKSQGLEQVKTQMKLVAETPDTSVLLIGESGTGKEIIARGIHALSNRSNELFGAVNMSAIPESLFESEFFGHKKGSFTGAIADKAGWFESANRGTLFLDEIGEMPMSLQVKLLRVLEDRKYTKVGTQDSKAYDIRIISATNKSVEELTAGKEFRLDLFHRIGAFVIHIPPLRNRRSDIPLLVDYFMKNIAKRLGKSVKKIHSDVYSVLDNYAFPGNIRELRNMVERAVIMSQDGTIQAKHFFLPASQVVSNTNINEMVFDLKELEKQTIIRALKKVDYNKSEAAKLLNLEWNALYRRIQKYGIDLEN